MKKKIIILLVMISILIVGFFCTNVFIVNDDEIIFPVDSDELLSEELPDLEQLLRWQSEIEIRGFNTIFSDEITCTVIALDAASYIKNNIHLFETMNSEEFNIHISEAIKAGKMKSLSTEIILPVQKDGFLLIAETENNIEFYDASCGGLYSLYNELIVDAINNDRKEGDDEQN